MNGFEKFREESARVRREVRERTAGYITAALGLVAGLAWNEAIKAFIEYFFPVSQNSILAKLIYAIAMTIVVVVLTVYLMRFTGKERKSLPPLD